MRTEINASKKTFLIPLSTFFIGGICGASVGINWTAGSISPLRLFPVTQEDSARSYGVGQGTALLNCMLFKSEWIPGNNEQIGELDIWHQNAFSVRWRSLHWSKYPAEWNYFWQGYNDTVKYYRDIKTHPLSKHNPGICRQMNPIIP